MTTYKLHDVVTYKNKQYYISNMDEDTYTLCPILNDAITVLKTEILKENAISYIPAIHCTVTSDSLKMHDSILPESIKDMIMHIVKYILFDPKDCCRYGIEDTKTRKLVADILIRIFPMYDIQIINSYIFINKLHKV